jgi:hypothetical protein
MEDVMKKALTIGFVLCAVLLGAVAAASASTVARMRVEIGFAFYADNQLMPAGDYWFEIRPLGVGTLAGSPISIRSDEGAIYQFLSATAVGSQSKEMGTYVVFNKVGGSYFLRTIQQGELRGSLPKSRSEKEVKMADNSGGTGPATEIVILAAAR